MTIKITKEMRKLAKRLDFLMLAGWMDSEETVFHILDKMRAKAIRQKDKAAIKFLNSYMNE